MEISLFPIDIFTQPLHMSRMRHKAGLNLEISFSLTGCQTNVKAHSLSYYLLISGGRIAACIPFLRVLARCQMQAASTKIRTRVAMSISYHDDHYAASKFFVYVWAEDLPQK